MKFFADFHIHSKFSRATSRNLDFENLYLSAQQKGLMVIGTGDFTHPAWFAEIETKLEPAEPGLFKLKDKYASICDHNLPSNCQKPVRFILATEISNIYKKAGKVRKNHNVVFFPDLKTVRSFNFNLDRIGNINSDGRPILGLDAKELLKIVLDTSDDAFLIPAHIWTPWFSVLGAKSGFDSLEECFEELTPHIFAVETGLSSDPPMNWRVSFLDNLTLVSNSDAHSPAKLGREANVFNTRLDYQAIRRALADKQSGGFRGTLEFYPAEGKYHADGHRKCNVCLTTAETIKSNGLCPQCHKPLTIGVLYRVEQLADRPMGYRPAGAAPYHHLIPLNEILSEIFLVGPATKRVQKRYAELLQALGPELDILHRLPIEQIECEGDVLLAQAIERMRQGQVSIDPGYDGQFGKIKLFVGNERQTLRQQKSLFVCEPEGKTLPNNTAATSAIALDTPISPSLLNQSELTRSQSDRFESGALATLKLNSQQRDAVEFNQAHLIIVAGPGTGKTHTLTQKIAHLIKSGQMDHAECAAITFTNKAAQEMSKRLKKILGPFAPLPNVATFHAFSNKLLQARSPKPYRIIDEEERLLLLRHIIRKEKKGGLKASLSPAGVRAMIVACKQRLLGSQDDLSSIVGASQLVPFKTVYRLYEQIVSVQRILDYEDLLFKLIKQWQDDPDQLAKVRQTYRYVFVDEYQDINYAQYQMIKMLIPPSSKTHRLCVIGDPNQAIYGFRGSDVRFFDSLIHDYNPVKIVYLERNYRSTQTILQASRQILGYDGSFAGRTDRAQDFAKTAAQIYSSIDGFSKISIMAAASARTEAVAIGKRIEKMMSGFDFLSAAQMAQTDNRSENKERAFSDFAVLFRTRQQAQILAEVFTKAGIPYQLINRKSNFAQAGVAELLAAFKLLEGAATVRDFECIRKILMPGLGKRSQEIIDMWSARFQFNFNIALLQSLRLPVPDLSPAKQRILVQGMGRIMKWHQATRALNVSQRMAFLHERLALKDALAGKPDSRQAVDKLIAFAASAPNSNAQEFLTLLALQTDADAYEAQSQKVALMTIHAAKGMEFNVVFIAGCEKGFIPYEHAAERNDSAANENDLQEEIRLFYVAMTRAREQLFLSYAAKRLIFGRMVSRQPSPFIPSIAAQLIEKHKNRSGRQNRPRQRQLKLFH